MKPGAYVYFYPILQGHAWKDHEHYGELVKLGLRSAVFPVWQIFFKDGKEWWANEDELSEVAEK